MDNVTRSNIESLIKEAKKLIRSHKREIDTIVGVLGQ
jgi:hypothetical protein